MKSLSEHLAELVGNNRMGLTTVITVADAIAADARFNIWFLDHVKERGQLEDVIFAKIEETHCLAETCEASIRKFQEGGTLEELDAALKKYCSDIVTAMKI